VRLSIKVNNGEIIGVEGSRVVNGRGDMGTNGIIERVVLFLI